MESIVNEGSHFENLTDVDTVLVSIIAILIIRRQQALRPNTCTILITAKDLRNYAAV